MNASTAVVSEADQPQAKKPDAARRWRRLVEDQRVSGLPVTVFCRERGVPESSLYAWRRRLLGGTEIFKPVKIVKEPKPSRASEGDGGAGSAIASPRRGRSSDAPSDAVKNVKLPGAAGSIELCLSGQRRLIVHRGFDRQLLLDVISALEGAPSKLESLA